MLIEGKRGRAHGGPGERRSVARGPRFLLLTLAISTLLSLSADSALANDGPLSPEIVPTRVLPTGDWPDSVSLELPSGPRGFAPEIAIVHGKDFPDGPLGRGYVLAAGGAITSTSVNGALPGYSASAEYRHDGKLLVPVPGGTSGEKRFSAESDEGVEFILRPADNQWSVRHNGWTWTFGAPGRNAVKRATPPQGTGRPGSFQTNGVVLPGTCGSASSDPTCNVRAWYLTDIVDPYGHSLRYEYVVGPRPASLTGTYGAGSSAEHLVGEMTWSRPGGERVGRARFKYRDRPDPQINYRDGTATFLSRRLTDVEVYFRNELFSLYRLTYRDQSTVDCEGEPYSAPTQRTLLKTIERINIETKQARRLRCIDMHEQPLLATDWTDERVANGISPAYDDKNILLPANIDGDGKTDLIVIRPESTHQVLVSTTSSQTPFRQDESRRGVRAWKNLLGGILFGDFFDDERGWTITDLTGDGFPDLLYEKEATSAGLGGVVLRPYRPKGDSFPVVSVDLDACQLRFAAIADIDGDGLADLVENAHEATDDCPRRRRTRWLRNSGQQPYFSAGSNGESWWLLDLPFVEGGLISMPDQTVRVDGVAVEPPFGAMAWEDPRQFVSQQVRFNDYNNDGISDVSYSFFRQWRLLEPNGQACEGVRPEPGDDDGACQWRPVPDSAYSEIFWGTGYGSFRASGLSAGEPTLSTNTSPDLYHVTYANLLDLNGSGVAELVSTEGYARYAPAVRAYSYSGVLDGYGGRTDDDSVRLARGASPEIPFSDHPHETTACCNDQARPVFGDFDGNGFVDILELRYDPSGFSGVCQGRAACVTIRYSERERSVDRVVASTNSWGGVTELEWGFTGTDPVAFHESIGHSAEVLKAIDGPNGREQYTYRLGVARGRQFAGFAHVERRSARGMVDRFITALSPALYGKPLVTARFGPTGTVEKLVVNAYGRYGPGITAPEEYTIDVAKPYVNPRIRECVYEVEAPVSGPAPDIGELVRDCWAWAGRNAPYHPQLQAAAGMLRYVFSTESQLADSVWGEALSSAGRMPLRPIAGDEGVDLWGSDLAGGLRPGQFRWTRPAGLPAAPNIEAFVFEMPSAAKGEGFRRYVTDWTVDENHLRPSTIEHHRSTDTEDDDLRDELVWESVQGTRGVRQRGFTRRGATGEVLATQTTSRFAGFDDPARTTNCGEGGEECRETRRTLSRDGLVTERHQVVADRRERWRRDWCAQEVHTDAAGRRRVVEFDRLCRRRRELWLGVETTTEYDGFHRISRQTIQPNNAEVADRREFFHDDLLQIGEDRDFAEPRVAEHSFGRLDLRYLDGFGRLTRRTTCAKDEVGVDAAGDLTVKCKEGTERVREWNLYGDDGRTIAVSEGFGPHAEEPRFTYIALRDAIGERLAVFRPPHVPASGSGAWRQTNSWRAPGRRVVEDALGRITVREHTTLSSSVRRSGQVLSERKLDERGRTIGLFDVNRGNFGYRYDPRSRLIAVERLGRAEVLDAKGSGSGERTWARRQEFNQRDQVVRVVNPDGTEVHTTYDVLDRRLSTEWRDPVLGQEERSTRNYSRDQDGVLRVTTTDRLGASWVGEFDGLGRRLSETTPGGIETRWTYRPDLRTIRVRRQDGSRVFEGERAFDVYGDLTGMESLSGDVSRFEYAGNGDVTQRVLPNGATMATSYLRSGEVANERLLSPNGSWVLETYGYDSVSRPTVTTTGGVETAYQYDDLDRLVSTTTGRGREAVTTSTVFDGASERPLRTRRELDGFDPLTTGFTYDSWNQLSELDRPGPGSQRFAYDLSGHRRQFVDETGYVRQTDFDQFGRPVRVTTAGRGDIRYSYEKQASYSYLSEPGRAVAHVLRTEISRPSGTTIEWSDSEGRVLAVRGPAGVTTESVYDGSRLVDEYQLAAGGSSAIETRRHYVYDANGRVSVVFGPAEPSRFPAGGVGAADDFTGYKIEFAYRPGGQVERIDAAGEVTEFAYDPSTGLRVAERFDSQTVESEYSADDGRGPLRVVAESIRGTGGALRKRSLSFDSLGRLVKENIEDGRHHILKARDGFDPWGSPLLESRQSGPAGGRLREEVAYNHQYDRLGRPVARGVSIEGRPVGTEKWEYYANGTLRSETTLFGERFLHDYGRVFDYKLDRILRESDREEVAGFLERDAAGRSTRIRTEHGTTETSYASDGRVEMRQVRGPQGNLVSTWNPQYDARRRVESEEFTHGDDAWSKQYGYSAEGFLVRETSQRAGEEQNYEYAVGAAGQRLETRLNQESITEVEYQRRGIGERVYAVNGGKIHYDAWDGVLRDQHETEFERSASGEIVAISRGGESRTILRDAAGVPRATVNENGERQLVSYGLGGFSRPLAVERYDGSRVTFLSAEGRLLDRIELSGTSSPTPPLIDGAGSILAEDRRAAPAAMTAFGAGLPVGATGDAADFVFAGLERVGFSPDLHLARFRGYDAQTGRFLSPDPMGLRGGPHRTLYAAGDPVQFVDPLGFWACPAQPGATPDIDLSGFQRDWAQEYQQSPALMGGTGNAQYDMTQRELAAGIEPFQVNLGDINLDFDSPFDPSQCMTFCPAPSEPGGGLPDAGVNGVVAIHTEQRKGDVTFGGGETKGDKKDGTKKPTSDPKEADTSTQNTEATEQAETAGLGEAISDFAASIWNWLTGGGGGASSEESRGPSEPEWTDREGASYNERDEKMFRGVPVQEGMKRGHGGSSRWERPGRGGGGGSSPSFSPPTLGPKDLPIGYKGAKEVLKRVKPGQGVGPLKPGLGPGMPVIDYLVDKLSSVPEGAKNLAECFTPSGCDGQELVDKRDDFFDDAARDLIPGGKYMKKSDPNARTLNDDLNEYFGREYESDRQIEEFGQRWFWDPVEGGKEHFWDMVEQNTWFPE